MPWEEHFSVEKAEYIISTQIECFCAVSNQKCVSFYILHPNGSGRSEHIANALYIVKKQFSRKGIDTALIEHSLAKAKEYNFMGMQYNSVVASNDSVRIYLKLGFEKAGIIPDRFQLDDDKYDDLLLENVLFLFYKN